MMEWSGPSLLIESTDSMILSQIRHQLSLLERGMLGDLCGNPVLYIAGTKPFLAPVSTNSDSY